MLVTFQYVAPDDMRFVPRAFAARVGGPIDVKGPGGVTAIGILTEAAVSSGGTEAWLTADLPDGSEAARAIAGDTESTGPFKVWADGVVSYPVPIRLRDPAEARRLVREKLTARGLMTPAEVESFVEGITG